MSQTSKAMAVYEKALELDPNSSEAMEGKQRPLVLILNIKWSVMFETVQL